MSDRSVTLIVPDYIYDRAQEIAEATAQPVEEVLRQQIVAALSMPLPRLPADEEAELAALNHLSDDALWAMAREQLLESSQTRMQELMDRNSRGTIDDAERRELEILVDRRALNFQRSQVFEDIGEFSEFAHGG